MSSSAAIGPVGLPLRSARRAEWLLIAIHLPFAVIPPTYAITRYPDTPVAGMAAIALAGAVAGALQLRNSLAAARGDRPRAWPVTFTAQLALAGLPFLWFGWDWTTPGLWFVFASALMLLPRRLAAVAVTAGIAGFEVAEYNAARAAGYPYPQTVLFMVYYLAIFVMGGAALYGSVRLAGILDDLFVARTDLAEQALARERIRVSRDLHDLLGQSLSAVSLKGDLAIALLPTDPAAAQREIESLTGVARSALHGMRAVARDQHDVSLHAETDSAGAVLAAAGICARIDAELPGLPPAVDTVLGWAVREGATNILRHSEATTCSITGRREDGRVSLEIVNDGARAGAGPGGGAGGRPAGGSDRGAGADLGPGTGLAGLAERARALQGSAAGEYRADGEFRLLVELPEVTP
jgi:two-component system sensor histidine kinase DesK